MNMQVTLNEWPSSQVCGSCINSALVEVSDNIKPMTQICLVNCIVNTEGCENQRVIEE